MLIRKAVLERIKTGEITLAFRRWNRPSVKAGSTLKTAIGWLAISEVNYCGPEEITKDDSKKAGYGNREQLLKELNEREGTIYRIRLGYGGEDPRIALREATGLDEDTMRALEYKLDRYDRASRNGAWTLKFLKLIKRHPMLPAGDLAAKLGVEKEWLKINVRKLKNLGLTISHQPGYELSPRGEAFLQRTNKRA